MNWFGWMDRAKGRTSLPAGRFSSGYRRLSLILGVGVVGAALSLLTFWLLRVQETRLSEERFRRHATERVDAIRDAMTARLGTIQTLGAFYAGSELVDNKEFQTFVKPLLQKREDIQSLGWAPRLPDSQRLVFEQAVGRAGSPKFEITERNERGQFVRAAKRPEYYPIRFIEPLGANKALLGFDIGANPGCDETIRQALATGQAMMGPFDPRKGNAVPDRPRLYVIEPARNEPSASQNRPTDQPTSDGFVFGILDAGALVESAMEPFFSVGINMSISVSTGDAGMKHFFTRASRLYNGPPLSESNLHGAGNVHFTGEIELAGCRFQFDCIPLESFLAGDRTWMPLVMLLAGLLVTGLLVGYLFLLTGRAARVEQLVAERTLALGESEQRFRRLVENAGDAMFLHDERGKIWDVNQRACDSLGYTREELLSMNVSDIDIQCVFENFEHYWKLPPEKYPISFEGVHRRKDGVTFPVELRLTPLKVNGERLVLALARDITERKRLQKTLMESERRFRGILDHTYQFIGLMTPDGIITQANKSALAFSGVSEDEVIGKPFWETPWWAHSPALQDELREAVKRAAAGDFIRMEATHLAANGDLHWIDFSLKPVKDDFGRVVFLIPEGRDITEHKRADEALQREQRLLRNLLDLHEQERKLVAYEIHDGLAQQLTGALFKFQSIDRLCDRDPDAARELFDEAVRLLRDAMSETRRLIGGLRPPILDESGVVAALDYLIAERRQSGGPEIEFLHPEEFDRLAAPLESSLFRITQEALTNACRYSQSEKVSVELRREGDRVRVEVRDWGIGFDPTRIEGGHFGIEGIRERARLLGGSTEIESAPGQGTRIRVELPWLLQAGPEKAGDQDDEPIGRDI